MADVLTQDKLDAALLGMTRAEFDAIRKRIESEPTALVRDLLALFLAQSIRFNHPGGLPLEQTLVEYEMGFGEACGMLNAFRERKGA